VKPTVAPVQEAMLYLSHSSSNDSARVGVRDEDLQMYLSHSSNDSSAHPFHITLQDRVPADIALNAADQQSCEGMCGGIALLLARELESGSSEYRRPVKEAVLTDDRHSAKYCTDRFLADCECLHIRHVMKDKVCVQAPRIQGLMRSRKAWSEAAASVPYQVGREGRT